VIGSIGGQLGIYPGQYWNRLAPLALLPSVAVGDNETTTNTIKKDFSRFYDYVGQEVWAGRRLEVALYQRYRYTTTGPDAEQSARMTLSQNRIVYRPVYTSPITLLVNYEGDDSLNNEDTGAPGTWANKQIHNDSIQWLMRWSQVVTTRLWIKGGLERTSNTFSIDPSTHESTENNYNQYTYGGEWQFRFYPLEDVAALYIYQATEWKQIDRRGTNAYTGFELMPSAGIIWRLGDKLYLDGHCVVDYLHCLSGDGVLCRTQTKVAPYLFFTMNL
jgi:hypothetical protein